MILGWGFEVWGGCAACVPWCVAGGVRADLGGEALDYIKLLDASSWAEAAAEIMDKYQEVKIDKLVKQLSDTKNLAN
ncbi:MAG: hypothetical protein ACI91B_004585 [Planctomycetota bacterium]